MRARRLCPGFRPFVCYSFDERAQDYPPWLQTTDTQKEADKKPDASEAADCIAPVKINDNKETLYFPFNLCTREMVASGLCEGKSLSNEAYVPKSIPHTTQYFLQCDAGFVIPQKVVAAAAADRKLRETCIPSLQLASGYLQTDKTPLENNPYDVFDPLQPKYCPKGGRQAGEKCDPMHLCMPNPQDIDPKGSPPYYALRRALSGPYASLKSEEETIDLWQSLKVPETPAEQTSVDKEKAEAQHADRVKRQSSTLPAVSYPRCIKTDGLPADQKAIVEADELLDCDRNPFYKELGHESLTVTKLPLCTEVDPNQKFCRTSADSQSTKPAATTPAAEGSLDWLTVPEPWDLVSFVLACIGNTLMVIAIALAWYIRFGRPEKDDDDDDDEEMESHSRKHDSSKKKTGDDDDA
ncbi:unnamed protein product, partial [Mesorhabditis spiculigera]